MISNFFFRKKAQKVIFSKVRSKNYRVWFGLKFVSPLQKKFKFKFFLHLRSRLDRLPFLGSNFRLKLFRRLRSIIFPVTSHNVWRLKFLLLCTTVGKLNLNRFEEALFFQTISFIIYKALSRRILFYNSNGSYSTEYINNFFFTPKRNFSSSFHRFIVREFIFSL